MGAKPEKWFSMRTDFYGQESYTLGLFEISPAAVGLFVACVAYACKYNLEYVHHGIVRMYGGPRPKRALDELIAGGFLTPRGDRSYDVEHEGTLWKRGSARGDRRAIPVAIRAEVYERDGYACVLCGVTAFLSLDHIQPYSKGGQDTVENLRVLCRSCNSKKGARTDGA